MITLPDLSAAEINYVSRKEPRVVHWNWQERVRRLTTSVILRRVTIYFPPKSDEGLYLALACLSLLGVAPPQHALNCARSIGASDN